MSGQTVPVFEIIVVSYRSRDQIEGLLAGLPDDLPVALVDNARNVDGLAELAAGRANCRYVDTGGGAGFARAANLGVRTSRWDHVVLVNPDSRPSMEALTALVGDVVSDQLCASSSALNIGPDGRSELGTGGWEPNFRRIVVHAAALHKVFPRSGLLARPAIGEQIELDWAAGSCMALHRQRFLDLGGFDERFYVYSEDVAFGRAVRLSALHQKLRTDIAVSHASGGSGAPSLEMMRLRGASSARYLRHHRRPLPARCMAAIVGAGYLMRALAQAATGRRQRSREHLEYAKGAFTARAWVAGEEVTNRG
ncbi:MAG: glycosyltransferase-like [Propionibacteriaceae bacterium]|nr:glycosyltransferase-like [Propionibacteriaceae bacterium]